MNVRKEYTQGATVKFKGGLGRGEHYDQPGDIHIGIVNGPTRHTEWDTFVPVHVASFDRNIVVNAANIVEVVQP